MISLLSIIVIRFRTSYLLHRGFWITFCFIQFPISTCKITLDLTLSCVFLLFSWVFNPFFCYFLIVDLAYANPFPLQGDQLKKIISKTLKQIDEFAYPAVVLDLFIRKCIGWKLGRNIDMQLTLTVLAQALEQQWTPSLQGLIRYSDQGVQYASNQYVDLLKEHDFQISMSRKGNLYDDVFIESFIKTFRYKEVYLNEYETFSDALGNIGRFIDDVYNKKRLHSSLGYKSPDDFER